MTSALTAGADCRVVVMDLFDGQLLHTPMSRGTRALSCSALLRRLVGLRRIALARFRRLLWYVLRGTRLLIRAVGLLGRVGLITTMPALPRRAAARWTGTVAWILIEPLVRGLQVRQQLGRQCAQLRLRQLCQIAFVELGEIVTRQLHVAGRSTPASALALAPVATRSCHRCLSLSRNQMLFNGRV